MCGTLGGLELADNSLDGRSWRLPSALRQPTPSLSARQLQADAKNSLATPEETFHWRPVQPQSICFGSHPDEKCSRCVNQKSIPSAFEAEAIAIHEEDKAMCDEMALTVPDFSQKAAVY